MDIDTRIRRRERRDGEQRLVTDYHALSPVDHIADPPGRGPILERILDHLDPVFEGSQPADAVFWGPPGSGKSAIVTALFDRLAARSARAHGMIQTTTRAQAIETPAFAYLDTRTADSRFQLYHETLDALTEESIPEHGVSTEDLQTRLRTTLVEQGGAVVAVDHVGEPRTMDAQTLREHLGVFGSQLSLFLIMRQPPEDGPESVIEMPAYGQQVLIDVLMTRASDGIAGNGLDHSEARTLAQWAGGNAHDALAALFGAAETADTARRDRITAEDIEAGIEGVPDNCVSLGWVLTLPANRQHLLRELLRLEESELQSVAATTDALAARPNIDLSAGTIRRFLYELAEDGIVERVRSERTSGQGRPPSRIEPRFPTLVFERLYEMQR